MYTYQILAIVALIFYVLAAIFILLFLETDNGIVGFVCVMMCIVAVITTVVSVTMPKPAQVKYERLQRNIDRADKEMQKFLIDHPEFQN